MPRYFFHIHDNDFDVWDDEGMIFADDVAAKREGETSARDILGHDIRWGIPICGRHVEVVNSEGHIVAIYGLQNIVH